MNVKEIKKLAAQKGIAAARLRKKELIRAIQAAEQNPVCFMTDQAGNCGETSCLWRSDCR
ncbi:MAG: SAP domain-containing protein [Pelovirga sp.]